MDIQSFVYGYLFQFDKNGKDLINYGKVQGGFRLLKQSGEVVNDLGEWSTRD